MNKKPISTRLGDRDTRKVITDFVMCSKLHSTANSAQYELRQPKYFEKKFLKSTIAGLWQSSTKLFSDKFLYNNDSKRVPEKVSDKFSKIKQ